MAQSSFREGLDEFLDQSMNLGVLPTKMELVPDCETKATILSVEPRFFPPRDDNPNWTGVVNVMFTVNDPKIKEETGLPEPKVQLRINLDIDPDWDGNGNPPLLSGKNRNIGLGRLLTALGINDGRTWKFSHMVHEELWVRVQRPYNEASPYADVAAVGREPEDVRRGGRTTRR